MSQPKNKRFQYSPSKVKNALKAIDEGMKVATASKLFNIPRTTLRNKISGVSPQESTGHCGPHSVLGEKIERKLVDWVLACSNMGFPVTKENLCASVQKLIESADSGSFKAAFANNRPGKKWYYGFLKRHKVLSQKHAEYVNRARASVTEEKIRNWFQEVFETLNDKNVLDDPTRIFNMDETSFFLAPKGELIIGPRGRHVYDESSNSDKDNVTTLFAVNAAGKFAPPLTLYKYSRIPAALVKAAPPNWGIGKTENGWMTGESFFEYITNVFDPFLKEAKIPRPVVIFLDGHCSHLTLHLSRYCRENQIILVALHPNSTHFLQPLDVAVFGPMKKMWKKIVQKWRFDNNGTEISKADVPAVLSQIISEPKMVANVCAGFRATGLFPFNANNVDYCKIVVRSIPASTEVQTNEELKSHFRYIENQIDCVLLDEFKATKRRNHDWEGNPEALLLFQFWSKIADEVEMHAANGNSGQILPDNRIPLSDSTPFEKTASNTDGLNPSSSHKFDRPTIETSTLCTSRLQNTDIPSTPTNNLTPEEKLMTPNSTSQNSDTRSQINNYSPLSSTNVQLTPPKSLATVFENIVTWPEPKQRGTKRKKEYTPSVVTSDKWVEYHELKEREKQGKEHEKRNRKAMKELKLKEKHLADAHGKKCKTINNKQLRDGHTSSEEEEEWTDSGSSLDDNIIGEDNEMIENVKLSSSENLKVGDFILVKFSLTGNKRTRPAIFKYVSVILKVISNSEYEIQCLKSSNAQKNCFEYIENDVSTITAGDILGKLPDPVLMQEGRSLKTKFPGSIDTYEK